jgi:group I intron endonuclease
MLSGIYCIENIENGKMYIGKGINIVRRMNSYHKGCTYIYNALQFYGKDAFIRYVVEYCDPEKLEEWEKYYIKEWNTRVPNGYNLTEGGYDGLPSLENSKLKQGENNPSYGKSVSPETRKKISLVTSGKNNPNYGKRASLETRNMALARIGRKNPNALSRFHGVSKGDSEKWRAILTIDGKSIHLGTHNTQEEAAQIYDKFIIENNLPNPLNFPENYNKKE